MTLIERARTIRDSLDAGVPIQDVRCDVDALIADVELCGAADLVVSASR